MADDALTRQQKIRLVHIQNICRRGGLQLTSAEDFPTVLLVTYHVGRVDARGCDFEMDLDDDTRDQEIAAIVKKHSGPNSTDLVGAMLGVYDAGYGRERPGAPPPLHADDGRPILIRDWKRSGS